MNAHDDLSGRVAWVTGAAGTIGAEIAAMLARDGATVILSGRTAGKLAPVVSAIDARLPDRATAWAVDLADAAAVDAAGKGIIRRFGGVDILVNSVAEPIFGDPLTLNDDAWVAVMQAKFFGYLRTMRAVLPAMIERRYGRIVNVSGRGGRQPTAAHMPGSSANAAVNLLSKGFADMYGAYNIRINVVAPGPIASPRIEQIARSNAEVDAAGANPPERKITSTPLQRLGTANDVADAVAWLVSERSAYTTGAIIPVDGGGTSTV